MGFEGGTGKTGKFGVKGALQRGHTVKMLARSPDKVGKMIILSGNFFLKVKTIFNDLFGEEEGPVQFEKVCHRRDRMFLLF